jgi:hypothetical protein
MSQNVWATIMPFGPVTLIFYWPKKKNSGQQMLALIGLGALQGNFGTGVQLKLRKHPNAYITIK